MTQFGRMLSVLGALMLLGAFLVGLGWSVATAYAQAGMGAAVLAVLLSPLTFAVAPWYFALDSGNWLPVLLAYGTSLLALPLILAGKALAGDYADASSETPPQNPMLVPVRIDLGR